YPGTFVPLLQVDRGRIVAVIADQVGMPSELVATDGTLCWSAYYTPCGRLEEQIQGDAPPRSPPVRSSLRLLGQYWDEETGLACTRYRYWDPDVGRWCSSDPLGVAGGWNLFGFDGAPTVNTDELGLDPNSASWELRSSDGTIR